MLESRKHLKCVHCNVEVEIYEILLIICFIMQNDEAAVLQGEKEAEKMIVEAYSALLLAFLSTER